MDRKLKVRNPEIRREFNRLWDRAMEGKIVEAAEAGGDLTFPAAVKLGAYVLVGEDKYVFAMAKADVAEDEFFVDIASDVDFATGDITMVAQPTADDTVTIGEIVYKFVAEAVEDTDVQLGNDAEATQANFVLVVNATHPDVEIDDFTANVATITALVAGVAGNAIATTDTLTEGTDGFSEATLLSGADCAISDAGDALETAVTANTKSLVTADNTAGTVTFEAKVAGPYLNGFEVVYFAVGAVEPVTVKLANGKDGTEGYAGDIIIDENDVYISVGDSTIAESNWKKITLAGS